MKFGLKFRAFIVSLLLVSGLSALSIRLIALQVWERRLSDKAQVSRFQLKQTIPASRGLIVDRNGQVLAQNRPVASLVADVVHLNHSDILTKAVTYCFASRDVDWKKLDEEKRAELLGEIRRDKVALMTPEEVIEEHFEFAIEVIADELRIPRAKLREEFATEKAKGRTRIVLEKNIREDLVRRIENELQAGSIQGFSFERSQKRHYTMPTLAPHLVGFVNHKGVGQAGVEKAYQELLVGKDGERQLKRDENGLVMLTESSAVRPPKMGKHIRLTLDMGIQAIAEDELEKACVENKTNRGSIIVVDPHTGDILAMASRPHFDLNLRKDVAKAFLNSSISERYEVGSVMKIIAMAGALDSGGVSRQTEVDCGGGRIQRNGYHVNDHHAYGMLSFDRVLMKSSNTGAFVFAEKIGRERFYDYLDKFGFARRTGICVGGETPGSMTDPSNLQNFASATFGYGVSVTPLQLAMAYSVLANGGNLMKPRLVDTVIANNDIVVERTPVVERHRVIGKQTAREMCLAMEQVICNPGGTGKRGAVAGHRAGGKTGTAWKWDPEVRRYVREKKFLTFAGIVPVQKPEFVCIVTIDEPKRLDDTPISGGTIAAPVFAKVAARVAEHLNLAPTEPVEPVEEEPIEPKDE